MESTRFETLRFCLKNRWLSHTLHYCIMIHRKRMLSFSQLHYKFSAPCRAQNWACLLAYLSLKPWWTGSWKAVPIISFAILRHKVGGPNIGNPHILGEKVERVNRLSQSPHGTLDTTSVPHLSVCRHLRSLALLGVVTICSRSKTGLVQQALEFR